MNHEINHKLYYSVDRCEAKKCELERKLISVQSTVKVYSKNEFLS